MESTPAFVELLVPEIKFTDECATAAIIRSANGLNIELLDNASIEFMRRLIGVCVYNQ